MSSSDPLSFFAGEASSSSESESGDEDDGAALEKEAGEVPEGPEDKDKLPSPNTLFATVGRPAFLNNPLEKHINWDKFIKAPDPDPEEEESNIHTRGNYAAIPPPKTDEFTSGTLGGRTSTTEISAAPVRYSETDPKHSTVSDKLSSGDSAKRPNPNPGDAVEDVSRKKQKVESFRQKEKRKRDLGQSSRGKSYVEEEKRILRQQFDKDRQ